MNNLLSDSFEMVRHSLGGGASKLVDASQPDSKDVVMEMFFSKVNNVEKQIELITAQLHKLQEANEKSHYATKASEMKEIKEKMEKDIDEVRIIALKVKTSLEELDRDNLANRQMPGCEKGTGVDRSRTAMTGALKRKVKERISEFQTLRQNMQEEYREAVARRVFTVTGNRPDEETIEHMIETGDSEQIFTKAIQGQGRGEIMNALAEIQERCDTVKDIEKKLLHLQQMFVDMSVLVDAQGDMLDDIEAQVSKATDHVQSATTVLQKGKKLQRNSRKYACIAIVILLFVILVAVFSLAKVNKLIKFT